MEKLLKKNQGRRKYVTTYPLIITLDILRKQKVLQVKQSNIFIPFYSIK